MPFEIHPLMQDPHNHDAIRCIAVENGMTGGFYLAISRSNVACIASDLGKCREHAEGIVQAKNISFSGARTPSEK